MSVKLSIHQDHHERRVQRRQRKNDEESVDKNHPDKQRDTTHRHSGRPQGQHSRDEIDPGGNRTGPGAYLNQPAAGAPPAMKLKYIRSALNRYIQ